MASLLIIKSMLFTKALQKNMKKKKKVLTLQKKKIKCRICNEAAGNIPIFDNILYPCLPEEIKNFSGVTINESSNRSNQMCQRCLQLLNGCIVFRDLCQKNNRHLEEISVKTETKVCKSEKIIECDSDECYNFPSPVFSEITLWNCPICKNEFDESENYNYHISKCSSEKTKEIKTSEKETKKRFLCDICGKTAHSNANLLVHMSTHENIFPFKCDECPYQGRTIDLLKVHKRSHMADKPFKCSQCPKSTTTASNLAKHMRHVHSTTRPYKCSYCERAFSYQHDMKRHIKDIHLRQGTVECDICYKKFNT
ncbi:hypothetical protein ACJJTC_004729, partial [Scirpophaga incertulas]